MFITIEGIEGSGKTTQIEALKTWLSSKEIETVITKEPGGTAVGLKIRQLLLDPETTLHHPMTEPLLFVADRLEHVVTTIKPALLKRQWVISDRYSDSTYAYQVGGRKLPEALINQLDEMVAFKPDLTILIDLPVEEGLRRAKNRAALDRFEQEKTDFHDAVREAFLKRAVDEPHRIKVIDAATKSPEDIHKEIKHLLAPYIKGEKND